MNSMAHYTVKGVIMFNPSVDLALFVFFISLIIISMIWIIVLFVRLIPESDEGQSSNNTKQPSLKEMAAKIRERERRIAAGDTRLAELQAAVYAASDAQEKVWETEMAAARKRAADSPEQAALLVASQRLDNYEKELDTNRAK